MGVWDGLLDLGDGGEGIGFAAGAEEDLGGVVFGELEGGFFPQACVS